MSDITHIDPDAELSIATQVKRLLTLGEEAELEQNPRWDDKRRRFVRPGHRPAVRGNNKNLPTAAND